MDYKKIVLYFITFVIGLIIGKTVKINVKKSSTCPSAQYYLNQLRQAKSSDDYLEWLFRV